MMNEFAYILPQIILAGSGILLLLVITIYRNFKLTTGLAATAFIAAMIAALFTGNMPAEVFNLLLIDRLGIFFLMLILLSGLAVSIIAYSYLKDLDRRREEYHVVLLLGTLGASILVFSNHFISFFIGLELLSVSLYILISFTRENLLSIEASIKYLLLAGVASAILLMGMALIFAVTGKMSFPGLAGYINTVHEIPLLIMAGTGMIIAGIGFKLALVPFHLWTPDVYQGAPAPTTAFIATVSKASIVVIFIRFFLAMNGTEHNFVIYILSGIAFLSMMAGNLLALLQSDLKRLLAYSSIAHLGYILVALVAGGTTGVEAVSFYVVAYLITILAAFGIVTAVSRHDDELRSIGAYKSLFWKNPALAASLTIILLSLAGIPLTVGFIGKYYLLFAGLENDLWFLVLTLIISSVIGLFYYLRVVAVMFQPDSEKPDKPLRRVSSVSGIAIFLLTVLIVIYGIFPSWIADIIHSMVISG